MEALKKKRTPVRATVTKLCNETTEQLGHPQPDTEELQVLLEKLQLTEQKLMNLDSEIMETLVEGGAEDDAIQVEHDACEAYTDKVIRSKAKIKTALSPTTANPQTRETNATTYKLPKIEVKKFSGEILDWLGWWANFSKIHDDPKLHNSDKFHYLSQAMVEGSKAAEVLKAYPQSADNYPKAITALKERFGKERVLKRVYVRQLLKMTLASSRDTMKISECYDKLEAHIKALESLGITIEMIDVVIFPLVESCIPEDILRAWQRSPNYGKDAHDGDPPKTEFEFLMDFIKREVDNELQRSIAQQSLQEPSVRKGNDSAVRTKVRKNEIPTAASLYVGSRTAESCIFCERPNHRSDECRKARNMSFEEKQQRIRDSGSCFICLKKGHSARRCKAKLSCILCEKRHLPIMCYRLERNDTSKEVPKKEVEVEGRPTDATVTRTTSCTNQHRSQEQKIVLMKTLHVRARGTNGKERVVRLLFDDGSQQSYIKSSLAKFLKCRETGELTIQNSLFGGRVTEVTTRKKYDVTLGGLEHDYTQDIKLINEDVICGNCPTIPPGPWISELASKKITLTDTRADNPEVDILIGSDLWGTLMTGRCHRLSNGLFAMETVFGWTLSGGVPSPTKTNESCTDQVVSMLTVDVSIPELWSLEAIGIRDSAEKLSQAEHDLRVKTSLQENLTRDEEGRYVVQLPWIDNNIPLPSNRSIAEKRLVSTTMKLEKRNEYSTYDKVFREWEEEGIIERSPICISGREHFLPHHPVFKPESLTTPVRPVFDASCRSGNHPSLNHCLEKGPNLLEGIPPILLRFRIHKIGVTADIRKAFQMIRVREEDRDCQKFLWWEKEKGRTMVEYRHTRVVFGMNCSPFILAAVLEHHLKCEDPENKPVADLLSTSLYVDNCVTSLPDEEQLLQFQEKSMAIMSKAKMELRQWETNVDDTNETKVSLVLGLKWDRVEDSLYCQVPKKMKEEDLTTVTKRSVLSIVSQIFDPIGFVCPALLKPKLLLQESWAVSMGWDEEWGEEESRAFQKWCKDLNDLDKLRIPRMAFGGEMQTAAFQLHVFCDASMNAYAAVVFARVENKDGVSVQLLAAKSRLAPLEKKSKRVTIPRLELLGCLIGCRLLQSVKESLPDRELIEKAVLWSDSTTALAWINREENWGTFVGNRVREIRETTSGNDWRHVPGTDNPADLPSRGCSIPELLESKWWEGHLWLREPEKYWPDSREEANEDEVSREKRKTPEVTCVSVAKQEPRFSSYLKNVSVRGWIRRFIRNCSRNGERNSKPYLTLQELKQGEKDLIREIQRSHFTNVPFARNLAVVKSEDGLLYVKTRLTYREDTEHFKAPLLLPKEDPIVHQLIEHIHKSNCHAGTQFVLNKLRERYWVIQGRRTVDMVIRKCVVCRRHSSKPISCDPAPLPRKRIEAQYAFETTGVDLAGPILLKGGKKAWIVVYTCAVYRGIYLDVVESLSSDAFLDSLERFTYQMGRPNTIFSDNGTNFVGAQSLMKSLNWKKMEEKFQVKRISWVFNPPLAPWWGGWWERLVRSIKELLRRMIGAAKLTLRELEKCLAAIAHTINNRPLTTLTENMDDLRPLTPAMFMRDLPISGLPERDSITPRDLQVAYGKLQDLKSALRQRFRKEYLANLVQRQNERKRHVVEIGHVVLVGGNDRKRFEWPLGKIVELFPGKDGKARTAKVQTSRGTLIRPLQRLYPLEVTTPGVLPAPREVQVQDQQPKETNGKGNDFRVLKTRKGRVVRKPQRYGSWNH